MITGLFMIRIKGSIQSRKQISVPSCKRASQHGAPLSPSQAPVRAAPRRAQGNRLWGKPARVSPGSATVPLTMLFNLFLPRVNQFLNGDDISTYFITLWGLNIKCWGASMAYVCSHYDYDSISMICLNENPTSSPQKGCFWLSRGRGRANSGRMGGLRPQVGVSGGQPAQRLMRGSYPIYVCRIHDWMNK